MDKPENDSNSDSEWEEIDYDEESFPQPDTDDHNENENELENEEEIEIEVEIDPVVLITFSALKIIGIKSLFMTALLTGIVKGGIVSLPITGAYSATIHFLNRKQNAPPNITHVPHIPQTPLQSKPSLFKEIGRDMSRRSFAAGIFFGTFMALDETIEGYTDMSEFTRSMVAGMTSASLATISYRKPRLVLPSLGVLLVTAFFGFLD